MDYKPILQMFCADEQFGRFDLTSPFAKDGYAMATNGHLAALVPLTKCDVPGRDDTPNVLAAFPKETTETHSVLLTCLQDESLDAHLVLYRKYLASECSRCRGEGEHRCSCGDEHECSSCSGSGREGFERVPICRIANNAFSYDYIAKIREAFEAVGVSEITYSESGANSASGFEGGDLKVMLMPLRDPVEAKTIYPIESEATA